MTASAGLSPWRDGRSTREGGLAATYEAADEALYRAKDSGRDQLILAEERPAA